MEDQLNTNNAELNHIPCFLCGDSLLAKYSKKDKPYFICDACGIQTFIRRGKGIQKLKGIITENSLRINSTLELIARKKLPKNKLGEIQNKKYCSLIENTDSIFREKAIFEELSKIDSFLKIKSGDRAQ